MRRNVTSAIAAMIAATALAACSGGDDEAASEPEITIDGGPGTFTPEEQEVVDAVEEYYVAFLTRGDAGVESAVEGRVTDDLAAQLIPGEKKAIEDADLAYIGEPTLDPEAVTIDGDEATFTGCQDNTGVFVVPAGETTAGVGSRSLGISDLSIELVREGGQWLIDQPSGERADAC